MKKVFLTIVAALTAAVLLTSFVGCGKSETPSIGILQYGEHASLDNCREGFIAGLVEAGLVEGKDFIIDYRNASFDDNICSQIAQTFSANNVKLMCGIATNAATACFAAAEDKNIPVIFNAISDPVKAKLDKGNVTGMSDKLPVAAQLALIRACQPTATTIGIVYNLSEPNSVSTIADYKAQASAYGFTIREVGITQQSEVAQAVMTLIGEGVDCFSNLTDNTVVGVLADVLEKTGEAGIPVYGSEIEQVKIGCVAAAGIDYYALGKAAGRMAAKVLRGEANCESMPYETVTDFEYYINSDALTEFGITLPESIASRAIEANGN